MRYDPPLEQLQRVCRMYHSSTDAAKALGVSRKHLLELLKRHNLTPSWKPGTQSLVASMRKHG